MCGGFVGDAASAVGNAVGDVVEFGGDYLESQVKEITDDPVKAAVKIAAVSSGNAWALPYIEGADTIQEGGSIEEGLLSAGKAYVGQEIGAELGSEFGGGEFATTGEDFDMSGGGGGFYGGESTLLPSETPYIDQVDGEFLLTPNVTTVIPGELGDIILDENGNVVLSSGSDIKAPPSSFNISPSQALQALRGAGGLLGGKQQPQQQMPQMQMGGTQQMPQGAVDYSGILNLLQTRSPQRNPYSLLG